MKIDITKIEGYDTMSNEEKIKALEEYEVDYTGYVDKRVFDKTSSELASLKKQHKELLSAEERAKQEQEDVFNSMKEELEALKKDKAMGDAIAQFLSLGYEESLAKKTAQAFVEGDMTTVFRNQKAHQEALEKKVKIDLMKGTPTPKVEEGGKPMTREQFMKLSHADRLKFSQEHPDDYKKIYEN
jgi:hypothetical protein